MTYAMRRIALFAVIVSFPFIACADAEDEALGVSTLPESTAGGLTVTHPQLPGNALAYLSCEGVLFGIPVQSTPLFLVRPAEDSTPVEKRWMRSDSAYAYTWEYDEGIRVEFEATPIREGLRLKYTLHNTSQAPMQRVLLHTCIPTTHAPAFFPTRPEPRPDAPASDEDYTEFYDRTFLWYEGRQFSFGQTEKGRKEVHLSLNHAGDMPIEWGWWVNGPERFDVPLIAVESLDGQFTTALGFERAGWATCNGGDDRACFHLFPDFGDLQPGESSTVRGCFYLMRGTAENALQRFNREFKRSR
jgi:hypothetical protein